MLHFAASNQVLTYPVKYMILLYSTSTLVCSFTKDRQYEYERTQFIEHFEANWSEQPPQCLNFLSHTTSGRVERRPMLPSRAFMTCPILQLLLAFPSISDALKLTLSHPPSQPLHSTIPSSYRSM